MGVAPAFSSIAEKDYARRREVSRDAHTPRGTFRRGIGRNEQSSLRRVLTLRPIERGNKQGVGAGNGGRPQEDWAPKPTHWRAVGPKTTPLFGR